MIGWVVLLAVCCIVAAVLQVPLALGTVYVLVTLWLALDWLHRNFIVRRRRP
jgi:hypothetical protein